MSPHVVPFERVAGCNKKDRFDQNEKDIAPTHGNGEAEGRAVAAVGDHQGDTLVAVKQKMFVMNLDEQPKRFNIRAEARVARIGSLRSSTSRLILRSERAERGMNCQIPLAPTFERALILKELSTNGILVNSIGSRSSRKICSIS